MRELLLALVVGLFSELPAGAADGTHIAFNSVAPLQSFAADAALVQKAAGRECRACRRICVQDYKEDCDDEEDVCRRKFVRCMRFCWNNECR